MTAELRDLLHKMQSADALDLVAVVTMDGLLIDAATRGELDAQQMAASACDGLLLARALGGRLNRGAPVQAIIEYQQGVLLLEPLDEDLALVMLAPKDA